jgi:hypothetical protein
MEIVSLPIHYCHFFDRNKRKVTVNNHREKAYNELEKTTNSCAKNKTSRDMELVPANNNP